jgi:hypothetical protein
MKIRVFRSEVPTPPDRIGPRVRGGVSKKKPEKEVVSLQILSSANKPMSI